MNERDEVGCKQAGGPGMDPNYSSRGGNPLRQPDDFTWIQAWHDEQAVQLKTELLHRLFVMPSGQRIRKLRAALGWTQEMAALRLGVSRRTVIRHEQSQHRRPWLRLELLFRLRQLESDHAEELIAYLSRGGREHA